MYNYCQRYYEMILVLIILFEIFTTNIQEVHGVDTCDKLRCYDPLDHQIAIQRTQVERVLDKLEHKSIPSTKNTAKLNEYIQKLTLVTNEANVLPENDVSKTINVASKLLSKLNKDNATKSLVLNKMTPIYGSLAQVPKSQMSAPSAKLLISNIEVLPRCLTPTQQGSIVNSNNLTIGSKTVSKAQREKKVDIDFHTNISEKEGLLPVRKFFINVKAEDIKSDRVDFVVLKNGQIFQAMMTPQKRSEGQIISPVISASANLRFIEPDRALGDKPVRLRFTHGPEGSGLHTCVFWNFTLSDWDGTSCRPLYNASAANQYVCECDHLTFFALLFIPGNSNYILTSKMRDIMTILTFCLLSSSCTALFSTILIYILYLQRIHSNRSRYVVQYQSGLILVCMCSSLLTGHLTFLIGSNYGYNDIFCKIIGGIIHLAYLSAFSWSTVEGVNLYFTFIFVALSNKRMASSTSSNFFLKACVFAWGIPIAIVASTFGSTMSNYGMPVEDGAIRADKLCFLRPLAFYLGFLTPLLISLLVNIVIIIMLAVALCKHSRSRLKKADDSKQRIIGFIGICVNLNITWGLGAIQVLYQHFVTMYLFVVFNGIQGLLIFIFYCLVRNNIRKFLIQWQRESFSGSFTSTSTVGDITEM